VLIFLISSFFIFKPAHVAHGPTRVRIGAAIQGLMIGLLIGFVIVPLRMSLMGAAQYDPSAAPDLSSLSLLPAVLMLIVIRRGALLHVPVVSAYLRAYRRAMLLRTRDETAKQLARLDEVEGRQAAA
jgi:hypothetical protein